MHRTLQQITIFCCIILGCTQSVFAATEDVGELQKQISDRQNKIQDIQTQIDAMKKALQTKQLERVSLQNQLGIINGRVQKTKLDIAATEIHLQQTQLVLQQTKLQIKQKERSISSDQTQIGELVRSLDKAERQNLVSVFARGQTISDFFQTQEAYQNIDSDMTQAIMRVSKAKSDLDTQKNLLDATKQNLTVVKSSLETKHGQLTDQSNAKAQLLLETKQSEDKFQKLVTDLKRQYAATESEISSIERQVKARLKNKSLRLPIGSVALQWPTPSRTVTAGFHDPDYPFRHIFEHPGIDIRAAQGTPIRAAGAGVVAKAKNAGMGYSYIIIIHSNKISTVYGHISRIVAAEDDAVSVGDIIGYSGGTPGTPGAGPFVTGAHLHFEVRENGIPVNALDYLP